MEHCPELSPSSKHNIFFFSKRLFLIFFWEKIIIIFLLRIVGDIRTPKSEFYPFHNISINSTKQEVFWVFDNIQYLNLGFCIVLAIIAFNIGILRDPAQEEVQICFCLLISPLSKGRVVVEKKKGREERTVKRRERVMKEKDKGKEREGEGERKESQNEKERAVEKEKEKEKEKEEKEKEKEKEKKKEK